MEGIRQKSKEEKELQIKAVETRVGRSLIKEDSGSTPESLATRHPERYKHFIEILKSLKNPESKKLTEKAPQSVKKINALMDLDSYLRDAEAGLDKVLLPRQLETVDKILGFLEQGKTEGYVALPTGIGKTVIFSKFLQAATKKSGMRALVVGPTKIILNQNRWKIDEFAEIEAGAYYAQEKDLSKSVTVTTYASLRNGVERGDLKPEHFDVVIFDEAHRALGPETIETVERFPEDVIKIGFTSTPEFHEEKTVADILPTAIDQMTLREGIEDNLLAGLKVFLLPTKSDISGVERKGKEYVEESLQKIINTKERNDFIVRAYVENSLFKGKLAVAYCGGRQHAKDMNAAFEAFGVKSAYIDGETSEKDREEIFGKYKRGEVKVLCNAEVLIEGFDETEAELCINVAPTLSRVVAEQRGGRVLRRSRVKNNKIGYVLEVVDETKDSENTPVLFSEIAGAAEIMSPDVEKEERAKRGKVDRGQYENKGVEVTNDVVDDPDMIMKLTNKNMRLRFDKMFEYAPSHWAHSRVLARELGKKEGEIRDYAETLKSQFPDGFKKYLTATDILTGHYSPEVSDNIRRHFNPSLGEMITPREYAEQRKIEEDRARRILTAVETLVKDDPIRYEQETYYPRKSYIPALEKLEAEDRQEEQRLIDEAESRYWEDGDRTDDERENEYWDQFDPIISEGHEIPADIDEKFESFDEQRHTFDETLDLPPEMAFSENMNNVMKVLTDRERAVIGKLYIEGKTLEDAGKEFKVSRERLRQIETKALRKLRHPGVIKYIETSYETDKMIEDRYKSEEIEREKYNIEGMSLTEVKDAFRAFSDRLSRYERNEEHIGSEERKYYEMFAVIPNSVLQSYQQVLKNYFSPPREWTSPEAKRIQERNERKLFENFYLRAILTKTKHFLPDFSPDGEMVLLYDPYSISFDMRRAEEEVEKLKEQIRNIYKHHRQSPYWNFDWKGDIKDIDTKIAHKINVIRELYEYIARYEKHFRVKQK